MSNESNYWKGLLTGTIVGGIAGAITALLLAPKSGKELRKDLAEKSQEIYDKAADYLAVFEENMGSVVSTTVNEGKERAQKIITSAKTQAESILENADKVLQDAKTKASNVKEVIDDKIENLKEAAKAGAEAFKKEYKG